MSSCARLISIAALCVACHHESEPEPELPVAVHCVPPTRAAIDETVELRGHIEPPAGGDLPLASQVAGRIVELLAHEGEVVRTGQVIANVDDVASRDAVRQAEASLAQANASRANSQATLERTRALVSRGIAPQQELEDAATKAENDKQAGAAAQAALDLARRTLGRVSVRSAFGGVVTKVWRGAGAIVDGTAATPILQVAAASGAEFVADSTERELRHLAVGSSAAILLSSDAAPVAGTVRTVSSALDPATGLGTVRIALEHAPVGLVMGAHGRATIAIRRREGVLTLPEAALRGAVSDGAEVVVCAANVAKIRTVVVGYRTGQQVEIVSGLGDTEKVAVDHVLGLDDGTALREAQ